MANQVWQLTAPGTITLNDLDTPVPKPGPKQALIRIYAAALNPGDNLLATFSDKYPVKAKLGQVLSEPEGDRVVIHSSKWLSGPQENMTFESYAGSTADGMLRRWLVWNDNRLFRAPSHLSLEEASTLFVAGATAYRSLFYGPFRPKAGMTILTEGTGGVSCFAIMFAKAAGMKVIATSSTDEKLEVARKLGADATINYRKTPDWGQEARRLTDGKGVDLVVDVVGGESLLQAMKATRFGGGIAILGLLVDQLTVEINTSDIIGGALTIFGQAGAGSKEVSDELSAFIEKHQLRPQIAQVFEWEEADKALKAMGSLSAPGKIVVKV
ncbi:hypothetical protein B0A55_03460 [Friedmanniomyces simplex]|uniref:Enoyl reductase (ER) domain-containing protein n=1 Tax=Friedmanniomyces simplex TaxID=329884 RepID=A0A4U0XW39_9PEZI|nr:hypothetical protein B0A55_03460 [Friedmanniomyces simplex]